MLHRIAPNDGSRGGDRREQLLESASVANTEVATLEADLAGVDRAIHLLSIPMQHSDLFFSIKSHLDLVRIQLGLRRAELEAD
jgi:hypothetical protein